MKRKIAVEGFTATAPCAPYGIWEDPSRRTGAQALRTSVLFHWPLLLTDTTTAMSPTIRPRCARAFLQKA